MTAFVVGYDPGGNGRHGVAALRVRQEGERWTAVELRIETAQTLGDAIAWVGAACQGGRIVAAGADTLTEWNSGWSGWRPADRWLQQTYPLVFPKIIAPGGLRGAMIMNGAAFLTLLAPRFRADDTMVTEAHPKVAYYALTGRTPSWESARGEMAAWLVRELGLTSVLGLNAPADHCFDAGMAALAALRGCDGDWKRDLHNLPDADQSGRVQFYGTTHYWWPHR